MEKAIRKRGMRFVTTFHHERGWPVGKARQRREDNLDRALRVRPARAFPSLLEDPERAILYGYMPRDKFLAS